MPDWPWTIEITLRRGVQTNVLKIQQALRNRACWNNAIRYESTHRDDYETRDLDSEQARAAEAYIQ